MRVTQDANRIKTKCKKLFIDLDQSKYCAREDFHLVFVLTKFIRRYRQRGDYLMECILVAPRTLGGENVL